MVGAVRTSLDFLQVLTYSTEAHCLACSGRQYPLARSLGMDAQSREHLVAMNRLFLEKRERRIPLLSQF